MARRHRRHSIMRANPFHAVGRRSHRGRYNPFSGGEKTPITAREVGRTALSTGGVAAIALATGMGADYALGRFAPTLGAYPRAGIKAGGGLLLTVLLRSLGVPPIIAAGIGVGGMYSGFKEAFDYFQAQRAAAAVTATPPATPATTPATNPAGFPYVALPYGYQYPGGCAPYVAPPAYVPVR